MEQVKGMMYNVFNYSFSLGKVFNIPFKLHWSTIPFFIAIPIMAVYNHMSVSESLLLLALFLMIFCCVLLHELGHTTAARQIGVGTYDILLSPIGGIARLEHMPEAPWDEFKIAFAGPLVNLTLFLIIGIPLLILNYLNVITLDWSFRELSDPVVFISLLAISNFALFAFNLIPAFPMDGGRILRAFLASKMSRQKATFIAAVIGKILAACLILYGILDFKPVSSLIGIFVFMMADMENRQEQDSSLFKSILAAHIVTQDYVKIKMFTPMIDLINMHFNSNDSNFLIMDASNKVNGLIHKSILEDGMRVKENTQPASSYMTNRYAIINVNDNLFTMYDEIIKKDMPLALVMDYGELIGVIDQDTIFNILKSSKNKK